MTKNSNFAKTETVMQIEATECGAACLTMVLNYFGKRTSLEQMRIETDVSRDGCNAGNICRAAEAAGFRSSGYRRDADDLADMKPPCIIWWERNHFVVYEGCKGSHYYINDPAYGRRKLTKEEFGSKYSGIILEFEPSEEPGEAEIKQNQTGKTAIYQIKNIAGDETTKVIAMCAAAVVSDLFSVTAAVLISKLAGGGMSVAILLVISILASLVLGFASEKQRNSEERRVELRSAHGFIQKMFSMPSSFFEQRHPGDMVDKIRRNNNLVRFTISEMTAGIAECIVAIVCLITLTVLSPKAGVIAAALAAAGAGIRLSAGVYIRGCAAQTAVEKAQVVRTVYTGLCRNDSIINAGYGGVYSEKVLDSQRRLSSAENRLHSADRISDFLRAAFYVIGMGMIIYMCRIDDVETLALISVIILTAMFIIRIEKITEIWQRSAGALRDRQIVEDTESYSEALPHQPENPLSDYRKLQGNIELHDVCFNYLKHGRPVINNVSLSIPSGSTVGITGGTGSGKSTLGKLMSGMRRPTSGRITFDGRDLNSISRKVFTASVATVPQKPVLFTGSVRDNITMWNDSISREAVDRAAEDACIKDVILTRDEGFESRVGERGAGFSGGEQQRIEIARALATDPSVIILDEGTSGLDEECARKVIGNIRRRGCTAVYITQKKFILDMCNEVINLDRGEGVRL